MGTKITSTKWSGYGALYNAQKASVRSGGWICPNCGETRTEQEYDSLEAKYGKGPAKGVYGHGSYRLEIVRAGLFRHKIIKVYCFGCHTCGTEWESEPYRMN